MSKSLNEEPVYKIVDADAGALGAYPRGLQAILDRRIDGMLIRRVFSPECMQVVLERLADASRNIKRFPITVDGSSEGYPITIPRTLINSSANLAEYYEMAQPFREQLRSLFDGYEGFEARITRLLGEMSGGLPVDVAHGGGDQYLPGTFRFLREGCEIALHSGTDLLLKLPENQRIRQVLDSSAQLSYFVCVQAPEAGGELILYDLEYQQTEGGETVQGMPLWFAINAVDQHPLTPQAGDVVLFDGGRIYHKVNAVEGPRQRVTLGGFVAHAAARDRFFFWS